MFMFLSNGLLQNVSSHNGINYTTAVRHTRLATALYSTEVPLRRRQRQRVDGAWLDICNTRCHSYSVRHSTSSWKPTASECSVRMHWHCSARSCSSSCTLDCVRYHGHRPSATTIRRPLFHVRGLIRSRNHNGACLQHQHNIGQYNFI